MMTIKQGLIRAGYPEDLLIPNYCYASFSEQSANARQVALAAFARTPASAQTACIGVTANQTPSTDHRDLGAPLLIEIQGNFGRRWKNTELGPKLIDNQAWIPLERLIRENKAEWAPERIYRAKTMGLIDATTQLDFVDIGVMPAIEKDARDKLHTLISRVVQVTKDEFKAVTQGKDIPEVLLYQLIFKLITAKLLADTMVLSSLDFNDPRSVIDQVQKYNPSNSLDFVDDSVLRAAMSKITYSFPFSNIGVDTLAYVYENTMVTPETRHNFSTHLTPSYLADYMVSRLPMEDLPLDRIMVTDPMCGRGSFLLAALGRLRKMLPISWSPEESHAFFLKHIKGRDIDPFAVEVTRLSMTLADLPHPNGWDIDRCDIYEPNSLEEIASETTVFLTNPPFETFSSKEQHMLAADVTKPAELILRALPSLPDNSLVGLVLPVVVLDGARYVESRDVFKRSFEIQEILDLPDKVFSKADSEIAVVLARKRSHQASSYFTSYRKVLEKDFPKFVDSKLVSWEEKIPAERFINGSVTGDCSFLVPKHYSIWKRLEDLPKLGDFVEVHKGVEYSKSDKKVDNKPFPSSLHGVDQVGESLWPFAIGVKKWISNGPRRGNGGSWDRPWDQPKILANVAPRSRGPWRLVAARDESGLVATERFFAIWRMNDKWSLSALTAILNSALANAFVFDHDGKRNIRAATLKDLPLPPLNPELLRMLEEWSLECENRASEIPNPDLTDLLLQIDSQILKAYNLPPREERRLLDTFQGESRPGCRSFDGYYPEDFVPAIPLHVILSTEFQQASADKLLSELPEVDDSEISAMLHHILEAE